MTVSRLPRRTLSRLVSFGGATVRVEFTAGRAATIVEHLYRCVRPDQRASPHVTLSLIEDASEGFLSLFLDGAVRCRDHSDGAIGSWLLHLTTLELASRSTGGLLLHSAAVASGGLCVLLPGATGAGKTTLAAFLSGRGFGYMTDELTFVADGSITVDAFVRPLKIKTDGNTMPRDQVPLPVLDSELLVGAGDVLVVADARAVAPPRDRAALGSIVFPRFRRRSRFHFEPLSAAETALRLMRCTLNGQGLHDHGFDAVSRLASAVPGYALHYSSLHQVESHLDVFRCSSSTTRVAADAGASAASTG